jgi:hypothetical protein
MIIALAATLYNPRGAEAERCQKKAEASQAKRYSTLCSHGQGGMTTPDIRRAEGAREAQWTQAFARSTPCRLGQKVEDEVLASSSTEGVTIGQRGLLPME